MRPRRLFIPSTAADCRAGFKEALTALVLLRRPELEQRGKQGEGLRDLVFNHLLVRPELEGVRETAWLQAKVCTPSRTAFFFFWHLAQRKTT